MRHHRRMAREKFLKLLRLMKYAKEAGLRAVYQCETCGDFVQLKRGTLGLIETSKAAINEKTDQFSVVCKCTVRTVGR